MELAGGAKTLRQRGSLASPLETNRGPRSGPQPDSSRCPWEMRRAFRRAITNRDNQPRRTQSFATKSRSGAKFCEKEQCRSPDCIPEVASNQRFQTARLRSSSAVLRQARGSPVRQSFHPGPRSGEKIKFRLALAVSTQHKNLKAAPIRVSRFPFRI